MTLVKMIINRKILVIFRIVKHHQLQPNIILTMFHYKPTPLSLNFTENGSRFNSVNIIKFEKNSVGKIVYKYSTNKEDSKDIWGHGSAPAKFDSSGRALPDYPLQEATRAILTPL